MAQSGNDSKTVRVRFEKTEALYASQFIIHASASEVIVDFSTGYVDEGEGPTLPVHSRIAMSGEGARRLMDALGRALDGHVGTTPAGAALPRLE